MIGPKNRKSNNRKHKEKKRALAIQLGLTEFNNSQVHVDAPTRAGEKKKGTEMQQWTSKGNGNGRGFTYPLERINRNQNPQAEITETQQWKTGKRIKKGFRQTRYTHTHTHTHY
jgi:hypothetical protein